MCELIPENLQFTKKVADFKTMKVRARRMARGKDQIAASKNVAADMAPNLSAAPKLNRHGCDCF